MSPISTSIATSIAVKTDPCHLSQAQISAARVKTLKNTRMAMALKKTRMIGGMATPVRLMIVMLFAITLGLSGVSTSASSHLLFGQGQSTNERVLEHLKIRQALDAEYRERAYSLSNPFVKVNPFGNNGHIAEVRFRSATPLKISVYVRESNGSYTESYSGPFKKEHRYPVLGLYAGTTNRVMLLARDSNDQVFVKHLQVETDPIPETYPKMGTEREVVQRDSQNLKPGFYSILLVKRKLPRGANFLYSIVDSYGELRWLNEELKGHIFQRTGHGTVYVTLDNSGNIYHSDTLYEMDNFGQYLDSWKVDPLIHHEVSLLPNGNLLILSNSEEFIEDAVVEYDLTARAVVATWDLKDYIPSNRDPLPSYVHLKEKDWAHLNAMDYDPRTDNIVVSSRNQSAVIAFGRSDRELKWISGPNVNWPKSIQPYLLNLISNKQPSTTEPGLISPVASAGPAEWHWAQHCVNVLSDNRLFLFDNGRSRSFDPEKRLSAAETYSRAVEYQFDPLTRTISQSWEFGREYGSELYSSYVSGLQELPEEGTVLLNFGGITKDENGEPTDAANSHNSARLFEVTKDEKKDILFEMAFRGEKLDSPYGFRVYRALKHEVIQF